MGQVSLKGKDLLGLQNVSPEEIKLILDVAKKMKKSKVTINNWENGKTEIDYGNLTELCRLYSVTMDDIILPY